VLEEPDHEVDRVVTCESVPDDQHPEWWELLREGDPDGQSLRLNRGGQDVPEFGCQPAMEYRTGCAPMTVIR
jgi:hypothetical protein